MRLGCYLEIMELSFADKFSKNKKRFFILIWLVVIFFFVKLTFNFFSTYYEITKIQQSYYEITVINNLASYKKVDTPPPSWVPLSKISKRLQEAIISSEDGKFYFHPGYDLEQLRDAIYHSFVLRKKMRGASTITQQLVKNLFLSRDKKLSRKGSELLFALLIEKYADKPKILELYLNVIEYGKGLYGIDKATHFYFNKAPAQINYREAAFLAMLLPSPVKYSKSFKNKSLTPFAKRIIDSVLLKMGQAGFISDEEYNSQLNSHFIWEKDSALIDLSNSGDGVEEELEGE